MVWREGKDRITDCYFYMINPKGIHCKNKLHVHSPDVLSPIRPLTYGPDLPVPQLDSNRKYSSDSERSDMTVVTGDNAYKPDLDD